jgi:hypothetical protein
MAVTLRLISARDGKRSVYCEEEPGRRTAKEEARRIAANIVKLPTLKG